MSDEAKQDRTSEATEVWRVGRSLGRTLYLDDMLVGMVDTEAAAHRIVRAMNGGRSPSLEDAILHLQDNLDHMVQLYQELVAAVLHGDPKAEVDISPVSKDGVKALDVACESWRRTNSAKTSGGAGSDGNTFHAGSTTTPARGPEEAGTYRCASEAQADAPEGAWRNAFAASRPREATACPTCGASGDDGCAGSSERMRVIPPCTHESDDVDWAECWCTVCGAHWDVRTLSWTSPKRSDGPKGGV